VEHAWYYIYDSSKAIRGNKCSLCGKVVKVGKEDSISDCDGILMKDKTYINEDDIIVRGKNTTTVYLSRDAIFMLGFGG